MHFISTFYNFLTYLPMLLISALFQIGFHGIVTNIILYWDRKRVSLNKNTFKLQKKTQGLPYSATVIGD